MKLLYITNGITGAGGLERVLSVKLGHLVDDYGYEVHVISLNEDGIVPFYDYHKNITFHSLDVLGNPIKFLYKYLVGIKRLVNNIQPDIISVCDDALKGFFLPILLKKRIPLVYERHVSKLISYSAAGQSIIKRISVAIQFNIMNILGRKFDAFVVLTNGNVNEWSLPNLKIIPNPTSFYPPETSTLNNKVVIAVGKQGFQKGYDRLLMSWKMVSSKHPDWRLEVYGKFETGAGLNRLASDLGIASTVHFYPPEKDIESIYLKSSIYVMSSRFEGFGMVLIESMACGVPCVSYDCPYGPSDIIADMVDGILVPNGNTSKLADAINTLIENKGMRTRMGLEAKKNVKRYLPEVIVKQWDDLFKTLTR